jgi:hypothetical protein
VRTADPWSKSHERPIVFPTPAKNAGCPIQAVLWLEWDKWLSICHFAFATAASKMKNSRKQYRFSEHRRDWEAGTLLRNYFSWAGRGQNMSFSATC